MLSHDNVDIEYVRKVIEYARDAFNVDNTRIYAMGTALGGDFVNMVTFINAATFFAECTFDE